MSAPSKHMAQCVFVFWIASLDDQASSGLVDFVAGNSRLENRKSGIVSISGNLEHLLHSFGYLSRSDEIVSLDVATIPVVFHAKVQFDKVAILDSSTVVSDVSHRSIADDHGGTSIISPCRIQFSLSQKLVRKHVDILVPLARLDRGLDGVVDLLTLSNRLFHKFDLSWDQSRS